MSSHAVFRFALFLLCLTSVGALAQQTESAPPPSKPVEQVPSVRQSAMNLVEEALAGAGSLTLPANRLAIELRAFPILSARSEARARALVQQMSGEFAQVTNTNKQDSDQNPQFVLNGLRNERDSIARTIATSDTELALLFVSSTQPYLDDNPQDHALIAELAAQVALHDPRRAFQLAEQQLKETDDLPPTMINLLDQVQRNDAQAGEQLFRDILDHLKRQNLAEDTEALSFAASLLANQFSQSEAGEGDSPLHWLADTVATAALSSNIMEQQPWMMSNAMSALQALVPSKAATLQPANDTNLSDSSDSFQETFWPRFSQALSSGDGRQVVALVSQAPESIGTRVVQQAAWNFANSGDLEVAGQLADKLEPWQRNSVMQQAIRSAAIAAASRQDFIQARQLAAQITDEDSRAILFSDLAIFANGHGNPKLAEEMLGEAESLVASHSAGTSALAAQLHIAQAYLRVKRAQAIPLLDRSASQIEQALSAAAQLDGFLPNHSFEHGELILNQGFLFNSLIEPYAEAVAELATLDLSAARALANRLSLPVARLMAEVVVAAGILDQKDQVQPEANPASRIQFSFGGAR